MSEHSTINDFVVLSKLGKTLIFKIIFLTLFHIGSGAFSEVFRVKRKSD